METTDWLLDLQRLHELAKELGLQHAIVALSKASDAAPETRAAWVRGACEGILQELAGRRTSAPPVGAVEKWDRLVPVLVGLEQMSWRELADLDELVKRAGVDARIKLDALPAMLMAKFRSTVAAVVPGPADLGALNIEQFVARLRRALSAGIHSTIIGMARQLQADLARQMNEAAELLYPLAMSGAEIVRATQYGESYGSASPEASLAARMMERRERWRSLAEFDAGAFSTALGPGLLAAALESMKASELPPLSSTEFKKAALAAAHAALNREWQSRRRVILESVDGHITERFAELKRDIDDWLQEVQRRIVALCGRSVEAEERVEAARFEVLDICRCAGTDRRLEESA